MTTPQQIQDAIAASSHLDKHVVYLVINGGLDMSPGKIQAQTFQMAERLFRAADEDQALHDLIQIWRATHTKTITRFAETQGVFDRCVAEMEGIVMIDEGKNEVEPGSVTMFATFPINVAQGNPKLMGHKRIPMYRGDEYAKRRAKEQAA